MTAFHIVAGCLAVALLVYLGFALLAPEKLG
jgi:K+-transporting ATPase KdpF subunit